MGECPYRDITDVYNDKIGIAEPIKSNPAMELGSKFESAARGHIFFDLQLDVDPAEYVHKDHTYIRASLDGVYLEKKFLFEIKYMGVKNFDKVADTKAALPHHYIQMQWQFLASDLQLGYYVVYTLNESKTMIDKIQYVTVSPNRDVMQDLLTAAAKFWTCVLDRTPPVIIESTDGKSKRSRKKSS